MAKAEKRSFARKLRAWLLPHLSEVRSFEIKPEVDGDNLRVGVATLKKSRVVQGHAASIRQQIGTRRK